METSRSPLSMVLVFALWLGLVIACTSSRQRKPELTQEHRNAISAAFRAKNYSMPGDMEITDAGVLVATFEVNDPGDVRSFAEDRLMAIRNAMYPFKVVSNYRVTVNGPSPGPGMIRRYGSARLFEGGSVEWEPGLKQ